MGTFYLTKTLDCLLLLLVNAVFESSYYVDAENNPSPRSTLTSPDYEGGTSVEGVVTGTPDANDDEGTGECYCPKVIIQPPTCSSAPISTELKDIKRKLDEVLALLSPRSSICVPTVEPKCTTPELGEGLASSNCSGGVEVHAGTQCTYHCDAGITMQGNHTVSCGADGRWIQPLPRCRGKL